MATKWTKDEIAELLSSIAYLGTNAGIKEFCSKNNRTERSAMNKFCQLKREEIHTTSVWQNIKNFIRSYLYGE